MVTDKQPEISTSPEQESEISEPAETTSGVVDNTDPAVNEQLQQQGLIQDGAEEAQQSGTSESDSVGAGPPQSVEPTTSVENSRSYSEDEWRKAQSSYDKQIAQLQNQQNQLQQQLQMSQSEATIEAKRREVQQQYEMQGYAPEQAQSLSIQAANQERQMLQLQQEKQRLETEQQQYQTNAEHTAKVATARQLLLEKGINPNQQVGKKSAYDVLMATTDPDAMVSMADSIADLTVQQQRVLDAQQSKVPSTGPSQELESGQSSQSAPLNEKTLMERYLAGDNDPKVVEYAQKVASGDI
tara:strand:- start:1374 stop:2267 length:894 start_codon:yes stop_codon:yes gene_type:complete